MLLGHAQAAMIYMKTILINANIHLSLGRLFIGPTMNAHLHTKISRPTNSLYVHNM